MEKGYNLTWRGGLIAAR